ncbi:hypothetical protein [Rhizomicrobium electricum]|nr:hypothetical protein [Rhizomicrobium electricum]NIJ48482.1 hypothetical protein [Rhizomicrobium electricum]
MSEQPNPVEVGRKANELAAEFGLAAYREAMKRAETELAQKEFWEAVASELSPHCSVKRRR